MLPREAVKRFLPAGCDRLVVETEGSAEALREAWRVSPLFPLALLQAHLIDP